MFTEIIDLLLQKKAGLNEAKELEKQEALEAIDLKYAEQSVKLDGMLDMAGYVEPVIEEEPVEENTEEAVEEAWAENAEEQVEERVEAVSGETFYNI